MSARKRSSAWWDSQRAGPDNTDGCAVPRPRGGRFIATGGASSDRPGNEGSRSTIRAMSTTQIPAWRLALPPGLRGVSWHTFVLILAINTGYAAILSIEDVRPFWHPFVTAQSFGLSIALRRQFASRRGIRRIRSGGWCSLSRLERLWAWRW